MKDVQGIQRGKCNSPGCECEEYRTSSGETSGSELRRGGGKVRCEYCDHSPVQHVKIIELGECKACGKDNCAKYEFDDPNSYSDCAYCDCPASQHAGAEKLRKPQPQQTPGPAFSMMPQGQSPSMVPAAACAADGFQTGMTSYGHGQPTPQSMCKSPGCPYLRRIEVHDFCSKTCARNYSQLQLRVPVMIKKAAKQQLGLILSKKPLLLNKRKDVGIVIVGVVKESPVFNEVQGDKIRLLDVIETINDTPCGKILSSDADLQERFERYLEDKQTVKLLLNHSLSLPPISSPICYARKNYVDYKHLVVLRNFPESVSEHFGLTLSSAGGKALVVVKGVSKDSPADMSRVKYNDSIRMYMIASPEEISQSQLVTDTCLKAVEKDLENAQTTGRNVILFVQRQISFT